MEFREVVHRRRMVRRFEQRRVDDELLRRVLETARHAPSAGFSQGFDFLVLSEPDQVAWFWRVTDDPRFPNDPDEVAAGPTCVVLPFSNKRAYLERYSLPDKAEFGMQQEQAWPVPFWDIDTAMAMLLILLAAVDEGIGAWYFGITHGEETLRSELGVPSECRMLGVIGLGYPAPEEQPRGSALSRRRRAFEDMFHFGRW